MQKEHVRGMTDRMMIMIMTKIDDDNNNDDDDNDNHGDAICICGESGENSSKHRHGPWSSLGAREREIGRKKREVGRCSW